MDQRQLKLQNALNPCKLTIYGYPTRDVYNPYIVHGISVIYREHIVVQWWDDKPYIAEVSVED